MRKKELRDGDRADVIEVLVCTYQTIKDQRRHLYFQVTEGNLGIGSVGKARIWVQCPKPRMHRDTSNPSDGEVETGGSQSC